ncbi:hypothetical protein SprV_0301206900 [Sparganum proliferum]
MPSVTDTAVQDRIAKNKTDSSQRGNQKNKKSDCKKANKNEQPLLTDIPTAPEPKTTTTALSITLNAESPKTVRNAQKTLGSDGSSTSSGIEAITESKDHHSLPSISVASSKSVKTGVDNRNRDIECVSPPPPNTLKVPHPPEGNTSTKYMNDIARDQCLVIQGLPESNANTPKERVSEDLRLFQGLLNNILEPTEAIEVLKAFRLGKRTNNQPTPTRPRPLKVVLACKEQAGLILSRRFRIKGTNPGVFFSTGLLASRKAETSSSSSRAEEETQRRRTEFSYLQQPNQTAPILLSLDVPDKDDRTTGIVGKSPIRIEVTSLPAINRKLKFLYTNVQTMLSKIDELKIHLSDLSPDIISLTETWLNQQVDNRELTIPGYQLFRRDRSGRQGGGVLTYVKHGLIVSDKTDKLSCTSEAVWLTIKAPGSPSLDVLPVYRPPRNDPTVDARLIEDLERFSIRSDVLIMGDFNAPHIDWSSACASGPDHAFDRRLLDTTLKLFLTQHVSFPTRVREGQQSNCLDLLLTKSLDSIDEVQCLPPLGRSDHVILLWECSIFSPPEQATRVRRNIWRGDFAQMKAELNTINWESAFSGDIIKDLDRFDRWTRAVDGGNAVHAVYVDFKKAFDSVPHQRLLHKLSRTGIRGNLLRWIESFLIGRSQIVHVGDRQSAEVAVESGVPQGSVLGPTLFIIYVNDCVSELNCDVAMFADDVKLWSVIRTEFDEERLQADLTRLEKWSQDWLLPFNVAKCNVLRVGRTRSLSRRVYHLNGVPLQEVDAQKDLGVWVTASLKPSLHCSKVAKSAMSVLYLVKRAFSTFDEDCFVKVFRTFVRPQLEFAIQAWKPWTSKDLSILEKVQRRATKLRRDFRLRRSQLLFPRLTLCAFSRPICRRTYRRRVDREFRSRILAIAEIMREKYPPKSSSSPRGSSTGSESRGTPTSSPVDTTTSMADQWQSPYEGRPDSLPDEVEVTSRDVLRSWAVSTQIPLQHLTTLLKVMRRMTPEELYSLPLDARTLLGGAGNLPPIRALGGDHHVTGVTS